MAIPSSLKKVGALVRTTSMALPLSKRAQASARTATAATPLLKRDHAQLRPVIPAPHLSASRPRVGTNRASLNESVLVTSLEEHRVEQVKRDKASDVMIVSGASGLIGPHIALASLKRGQPTFLITRDKTQLAAFSKHPLCYILEATEEQQRDSRFMGKEIAKRCAGRRITYVNGVGVASVPAGSQATLEEINFAPFDALLSSLEKGQKTGFFERCHVVDLNSIALSILRKSGEPIEEPYLLSRLQTAQRLDNSPLDHLRLGISYVYCGPESGHLNMKHGWGPDQMANALVQVLIGSGEQMVQPVHIQDIVDAVFAFKGGRLHIDAVGPDKMTVNQFFNKFCDMIGTKFRPVHISHEMAEKITDIYASGHAAPYAVVCSRILETLDIVFDHQPMEALLGRDLITFHETFKEFQVGSFTSASPPIYEQIKGMLINSSQDPVKFKKLVLLLLNEFPGFSLQMAQAFLKT